VGEDEAYLRTQWLWTPQGDLARAESYARYWVLRLPDDARWLDLLGGILLARGRKAEGRELIERAIEADPRMLLPRIRLANELIADGELERAERLLARGLRRSGLWPRVPSALFQLAWVLNEQGEADRSASAVRCCLDHLAAAPGTPANEALRERAEALLRQTTRRSP